MVVRTRAFLQDVMEAAAAGELGVGQLTPQQTVAFVCQNA